MSQQHFSATLEKRGTRVLVPLPFDPNVEWGVKERHHITGTVNGIAFRGQLAVDGTQYFLPIGPAFLRDSGLRVGEPVQVRLSPEGPQGANLPDDVRAALESDAQARAFFESLPTFYRKNFMRAIEGAKRPETRAARIAEMIALLKEGRREK
jgi:hypothetical protein